ncbi:MAG: 2'-5' RNA ligase family protein [Acidimicrobiales bacterium]
MPRRRFAVALLLPDGLSREVDGLRRGLGDDRAHVAPHLTLVPPVNVREDAVPEALAVLNAAASTVEPFDLELGPVATFHPVNPVVYLAVRGALDGLTALRGALFFAPLARVVDHPFVPHVTIGTEVARERIPAALAALADFDARWPVRTVDLLEDHAPGRCRWNPVAEAPLGHRY